ncbi:MAG: class I SAM-dependent methyltransferase [Nitrospirae bacterium]|nr:class I SAM-dependent methyltransferase [Nitrospirota bacterium]
MLGESSNLIDPFSAGPRSIPSRVSPSPSVCREGDAPDGHTPPGSDFEGITKEQFVRQSWDRRVAYADRRVQKWQHLWNGNIRSVLDVGIGSGVMTEIMRRRMPSSPSIWVGSDVDREILSLCRKYSTAENPVLLVRNDAKSLPFRPLFFDLVFSEGSIHHFENPEQMAREMWAVVKPGGWLVLWDFSRSHWKVRLFRVYLELLERVHLLRGLRKATLESIRRSREASEVQTLLRRLPNVGGIEFKHDRTQFAFLLAKPSASTL